MKYLICYQTSLFKENRCRKDRNKSPVEESILNRRNLLHHRLHSRIRWDPNLVKKSTTKEEHDKPWKTNNVIEVWRAHTFVGERQGRSPAVKTKPSTPSLPIDTTNSPRTRSERQKRVRNNATEDLQHTDLLDGTNAQWENGGPDYFPCRDRPDPTRPNQRFFLNIWTFAQIRKLKFLKGIFCRNNLFLGTNSPNFEIFKIRKVVCCGGFSQFVGSRRAHIILQLRSQENWTLAQINISKGLGYFSSFRGVKEVCKKKMKSVKEVCFFHFMPQTSFHLFLNGFFHCSLHLWMMSEEALQKHKKQLWSQENEYVDHDLFEFWLPNMWYIQLLSPSP